MDRNVLKKFRYITTYDKIKKCAESMKKSRIKFLNAGGGGLRKYTWFIDAP